MHRDPGILLQPGLDLGVLVRVVIVRDNTQALPGVGAGDAFHEVQELGLAVPVVALIGDLPGGDLQCREQRRGAVALVVMGGLLRQAGPQWQDRGGAVQRLDLALLVHAQHDRVLRRRQIQPDHLAHLRLQLRIGGELERLAPPGLHLVLPPRPGHRGVPDAQLAGEQTGGPVRDREPLRRRIQRRRQDRRHPGNGKHVTLRMAPLQEGGQGSSLHADVAAGARAGAGVLAVCGRRCASLASLPGDGTRPCGPTGPRAALTPPDRLAPGRC